MRPAHAQVLRVDVFDEISSRRDWLWMKDVADAAKHISAVIEWHDLHVSRDRHTRFQVRDHFRVAANRHREGIQTNQLSLPIAKLSLWHDDLARPGFFKWKSTKGR